MHAEPHRYFVLISLAAAADKARIAEAFPKIREAVENATHEKDYEFVYFSRDGKSLGIFVRTKLEARQLSTAIDKPRSKRAKGLLPDITQVAADADPLRSDDTIFVFEVGEDYHDRGFAKGSTWLKRRMGGKQG